MRRGLSCGYAVLWTALGLAAHGCGPAPESEGRFWIGRTDAAPGSGGSIGAPPLGSGGMGAGQGSGGGTESGGVTGSGSGGEMGSNPTGGALASGGTLGSGGVQGTGGAGGAAGRGTSGGTSGASGLGGSAGASNAGGAAGSIVPPGPLTATLTVTVTTRTAGGRYSPDNVGAIWIADASGRFVKSLNVWAAQRRRDLATWSAATAAAGKANNVVDAITAATLQNYGVRMGTWNGTNTSKVLVPDGPYRVCFELRDGSGQNNCVDFLKSRNAQTLMPADTTSFTKRVIGYAP